MSEKGEKKEKATVNINIWFIIFLAYLIISLAFIFNQNQTIELLNQQIVKINQEMETSIALSTTKTDIIISKLENIIKEYKESVQAENNDPITVPVEVSMGTYVGSTDNMHMTLTLSENNIASVSVVESGDSVIHGTYVVAVDTVVFTSNDGLTLYTFTANENGTLKLVDSELTLSK